jgi:hypothetical protein
VPRTGFVELCPYGRRADVQSENSRHSRTVPTACRPAGAGSHGSRHTGVRYLTMKLLCPAR